jgi:preprotein translocase subunit SecY
MVFHFNYVGILARFPQAFIQEFTTRVTNNNGGPILVIEIIIWLLVIVVVFFNHGY